MVIKKLNIAIIGAGKISSSLAGALEETGQHIEVIVSRNKSSARILADKYDIKKYSDRLSDIPESINFFIIAAPDDAIFNIASELSELPLQFEKSHFIHLSGSRTSEELDPVKKRKAGTGSIHIMSTFPSKRRRKIAGSYAAVETESKSSERLLYNFARELGLIPFTISCENKSFYHLAGVYASNFFTGQIYEAEKLLTGTLNDKNNALKILLPIIKSTLANIRNMGTAGALSGPVERGDAETVRKHLSSLKKKKDPLLLLNYASESLILLEVSEKKHGGLSATQIKIKDLLRSEIKKIRL